MNSKLFLREIIRGVEGKRFLEKESREYIELRDILETVEKISRQKKPTFIHIRFARRSSLSEALWVGVDEELENITIFDGLEKITLPLRKGGEDQIIKISTIPLKNIKRELFLLNKDFGKKVDKIMELILSIQRRKFEYNIKPGKDNDGLREIVTRIKKARTDLLWLEGRIKEL